MARLPKDPGEAIAGLRLPTEGSLAVVGPAAGYAEAVRAAVGEAATVEIQDPPPGFEADGVDVIEAPPAPGSSAAVVVWLGSVALHGLAVYAEAVADGGSLWTVIHLGSREFRAPVTEGEVKRYLLPLGWRPVGGAVRLEKDLAALRFVRR